MIVVESSYFNYLKLHLTYVALQIHEPSDTFIMVICLAGRSHGSGPVRLGFLELAQGEHLR